MMALLEQRFSTFQGSRNTFQNCFFLTNKTTEQITHSTLEKDLNNPMCSAAKHQLKTTVVHSLIWQTSFLLVIFAKHREKSERERFEGMQKCENLEKRNYPSNHRQLTDTFFRVSFW